MRRQTSLTAPSLDLLWCYISHHCPPRSGRSRHTCGSWNEGYEDESTWASFGHDEHTQLSHSMAIYIVNLFRVRTSIDLSASWATFCWIITTAHIQYCMAIRRCMEWFCTSNFWYFGANMAAQSVRKEARYPTLPWSMVSKRLYCPYAYFSSRFIIVSV